MTYTRPVALLVLATAAAGDAPDRPTVVIKGGTADNGHNYSWTVTNHDDSPVVSISFPHYRATVFDVPERWKRQCTNLVQGGAKNAPGICTAEVADSDFGIARGESATFSMRVWKKGARQARGTVSVSFADGSRLEIPGVELPAREPFGDRYVSLLGLGSIFLVWLLVRAVRGKEASQPAPSQTSPTGTGV